MSAKYHYTDDPTPFMIMITKLRDHRSIADELRTQAHAELEYFEVQCKTPYDKRDADKLLHERWRKLESIQTSTGFFNRCREDNKLWSEILRFLEIEDRQFTWSPPRSAPIYPPEKPKREMNPSDFFKALRIRVLRSDMPETLKNFVCLGLFFLEAESYLPTSKRVPLEEKKYWMMIWPSLDKYRVMIEFRKSYELKKMVQYFFENESKKSYPVPTNVEPIKTDKTRVVYRDCGKEIS